MRRSTTLLRAVFHPNVPTSELYHAAHRQFTGKYRRQREEVDAGYHGNYTLERQALQDRIIDRLVPRRVEEKGGEGWLVFSAGAMGAGKTRTLHWMAENGVFPLEKFVFLDHDAVKYTLPEMWGYQLQNPGEAGSMTQKEAGYIVEIAQRRCVELGLNCLVDGSLRDHAWYEGYIAELRVASPEHKLGIIHVKAKEQYVLQRARDRASTTGRHIPTHILEAALRAVPHSVSTLSPSVDVLIEIDNSGQLPPRLESVQFPEKSILPGAGAEYPSAPWDVINEVFDMGSNVDMSEVVSSMVVPSMVSPRATRCSVRGA